MKKFVKVLGLMALVLCLGVALVACGDDAEGTYEYVGVNAEGTLTLELKDGKVTMKYDGVAMGEGTYKVDGEKITLTMGGESTTGTLKDGKITLVMDEGDGEEREAVYVKK